MASIPCDIVLLPNAELAEQAIAASQQLESKNTLYTLDKTGPFPHVSLYMTQLGEEVLSDVHSLLSGIASTSPALSLIALRYSQAEGFIDADYEKFAALEKV